MVTTTRRVLDLLAEGKVDASQAEELLDVLGRAEPAAARPVAPGRPAGDAGPFRFSVEQLVELASHDVSAKYVRELVSAGLSGLTVEQVLELADHDVSPAFVRELCATGLHLSVEDIVALTDNDVTAAYVRDLLQAGLTDLSAEHIVELACNDVDPKRAAAWRGEA